MFALSIVQKAELFPKIRSYYTHLTIHGSFLRYMMCFLQLPIYVRHTTYVDNPINNRQKALTFLFPKECVMMIFRPFLFETL